SREPSNECLTDDILDLEDDVKQIIAGYFDRKFYYTNQTDENLPNLQLNCQPAWDVNQLQEIKRFLNEAKNNLSTIDIKVWHCHTQEMHKGAKIVPFVKGNVKCELCTQAWCKFHEILCSFPHLVKLECENFNSFHLCEAPGAFVASLNHYLVSRNYKGRWKWKANTLNPMYEENDLYSMIDVDDFIQGTIENWCFGLDDTGDITSVDNIEHFKRVCIENDMNDIHLVTCDGSIDCANNPGDQESIVYRLHLCEIISGISLLCVGGCMVLKTFTLFESTSVCFMYLLSVLFKQLSIHKPVTSKPGNSELYVICSDFLGISLDFLEKLKREIKTGRYLENTQLFSVNAVNSSFLNEHIDCCRKFAEWQHSTITNNLKSF
ncbi:hypothetical protein HELRODRAFT_150382, partial [Helobdella robusta]|uniref:Cap-specific mRNA (nucleoside-2'-O-)-methyltransferase 2 n=1 Tax=Helobdella robusta TaxID=6412 RepID=T1EKF4_HELRO